MRGSDLLLIRKLWGIISRVGLTKRMRIKPVPSTIAPKKQLKIVKQLKRDAATPLPSFTYYPDPIKNKSIVNKSGICPCCNQATEYMYVASIYCRHDVHAVCPWCIADGSAAEKWDAEFQELYEGVPHSVPKEVIDEISHRTPGYISWQGNKWLFSETDALIFLGDIDGKELIAENNDNKIDAVLETLNEYDDYWTIDNIQRLEVGGHPSVYLFQDRTTGLFQAYIDFD